MAVAVADTLVEEGRRRLAHNAVYELIEVRQVNYLVVARIVVELAVEEVEKRHGEEVAEEQATGVVVGERLAGEARYLVVNLQHTLRDSIGGSQSLAPLAEACATIVGVVEDRLVARRGRSESAVGEFPEIAIEAVAPVVALVGLHARLGEEVHRLGTQRLHLLLKSMVLSGVAAMNLHKIGEGILGEFLEVDVGLLGEELPGEVGERAHHIEALLVFHPADGETVKHIGKFLVALGAHE